MVWGRFYLGVECRFQVSRFKVPIEGDLVSQGLLGHDVSEFSV